MTLVCANYDHSQWLVARASENGCAKPRAQSLDCTSLIAYPCVVQVVLENSNVAQLASTLYLLVHSLPQEDRYDTDDASAREIYSILVPESTLCPVQLLRHRQYCTSRLDWQGQ